MPVGIKRAHDGSPRPSRPKAQDNDKQTARTRQLEAENKNHKAKGSGNPPPWARGGKGDRGGGKDDRSEKEKHVHMPTCLIGKTAKAPDGQPLCSDYNKGGCKEAKDGERCRKGMHLWVGPDCAKAHSLKAHRS